HGVITGPLNAKNGHFITPLGICGMKKAVIFKKRLRRSDSVFPAVRSIGRPRHRWPVEDVLRGAERQTLHHPVDLDAFHVLLRLVVFQVRFLDVFNGTHSSVLSWFGVVYGWGFFFDLKSMICPSTTWAYRLILISR